MGKRARAELQLHALRDLIYSVLFSTLPWLAWQGWWATVLALLLLTEVVLTLWDFVVEDWVRKPLGGVYPGERIMHGIMGITYGAMLACLAPSLRNWVFTPTELLKLPVPVLSGLRWTMVVLAAGVLLSGIRDLCAAA